MASPPSRETTRSVQRCAAGCRARDTVALLPAEPLAGAAPFATYSLTIIVVALVCGFWPGMMAVALSVLIGWFLFLTRAFSFVLSTREAWTLAPFTAGAFINVALVSGLVAALLRHEARQLLLFRELHSLPGCLDALR